MTFQLRVRLTHFQFFIRRSIWHSRPFPNETEANLPSNNTQTHQEWLLLYLYPSSRHFPARASIACWVMEVGLLGSNLGTPLAIDGFLGTKSKGGKKTKYPSFFFGYTFKKKHESLQNSSDNLFYMSCYLFLLSKYMNIHSTSFLQLSMHGKGGGYPSGRRAQGAQGGQARSNVTGVRISCKQ